MDEETKEEIEVLEKTLVSIETLRQLRPGRYPNLAEIATFLQSKLTVLRSSEDEGKQ
jgi:hypothetical protein